jgi:hypothetical protein
VLEKDDGVRDRTLRHGAGERPLQVPGLAVRDEPEIEDVRAAAHVWSVAFERP